MKGKVIIRSIASKPPNNKQRSDLLDMMYQAIISANSSTQSKIVTQNSDKVFVLRENDKVKSEA